TPGRNTCSPFRGERLLVRRPLNPVFVQTSFERVVVLLFWRLSSHFAVRRTFRISYAANPPDRYSIFPLPSATLSDPSAYPVDRRSALKTRAPPNRSGAKTLPGRRVCHQRRLFRAT